MTVLIDVQPLELLEILLDKERLRQRLAVLEALHRTVSPSEDGHDDRA